MQSRISISGLLVTAGLAALATGCSDKGKAQPTAQDPAAAASGDPAKGEPRSKAPAQAPSRGPERPVYSLVDNRLSAHLVSGGTLVIPAGSAGFAKYTRFGNTRKSSKRPWALRQQQGDVAVGRMTGSSGKLDVPLTAAQAEGEGVVRIRAYSEKDRAFGVRINGNPDLNAQLTTGWSTVEVTAPAGQLRAGENELLLFARGAGLDVAWVQVGTRTTAAPADAATTFYDSAGKALTLPEGGGLAWYVTVPEAGRVTGDLADGTCEVAVTATAEDGASATGTLTGLGSAVDLAPLAGKAARVELLARGCPKAQLARAALVVPGTAPEPVKGPPPQHIVLFIMDSLRADRVRPWNPSARPETPVFDKLAETSAVFLQNYVQGNESRVSHASIWTSLYPIKHGMISSDAKLALKWTTVDEVAKAAGMYTAGVSANGYVAPTRWGFGQKWDTFANHIHEKKGLKGEDIVEVGLRMVEGKQQPWFLYLGTIDTHVSWRGKQPWLSQYAPGYSGRFAEVFSGEDAGRAAGGMKLSEKEIAHVRALYDSNVSYQDKLLGDLIAKLEEWGVWDKTMLIITADHGDEQWEDGKVGHGQSMRDMLVHVPLLVHYPAQVPAGKISEGAEVIDIVPTIADALGAPLDPEWQGEPLTRIAQGAGRGYPRLSMTSMYEDAHAGRMGRWKVRVPGSGTPRVFELGSDPDEMKDIAGSAPAAIGGRMVLDALWLLRAYNPEWRKSQWGNAANVSARFAADLGE